MKKEEVAPTKNKSIDYNYLCSLCLVLEFCLTSEFNIQAKGATTTCLANNNNKWIEHAKIIKFKQIKLYDMPYLFLTKKNYFIYFAFFSYCCCCCCYILILSKPKKISFKVYYNFQTTLKV